MALGFYLVGEHLAIPSAATYDGSLGTVAFWVKSQNADSTNYYLLLHRDSISTGTSGFLIAMQQTSRVPWAAAWDSGNNAAFVLVGTTTMTQGAWRHVALVFSRTNGEANDLYVNGVSEATANNSRNWAFSSQEIRIAEPADTSFWKRFIGDFAELGWWNVKLSAGEIAALAKGTRPARIRPGSLVDYWPLFGNVNSELSYTGSGQTAVQSASQNISTSPPVQSLWEDEAPIMATRASIRIPYHLFFNRGA